MQALTRTQSSLPCAPGHCATKTSDYKRHGTTTLFAAQNVGTGKVIYTFNKQHTNQEWIPFLTMIVTDHDILDAPVKLSPSDFVAVFPFHSILSERSSPSRDRFAPPIV